MSLFLFVVLVVSSAKALTRMEFDVSTIKPSPSVSADGWYINGGLCHGVDSRISVVLPFPAPALGQCVFLMSTLRSLIREAYRSPSGFPDISGGPSWADSDKFDIQ